MTTKESSITIYCDGLCEPVNPGGVATYGFVIYEGGKKIAQGKGVIGQGKGMTNNVAEYTAALAALSWLAEHGYEGARVTIRSDSMLLVKQMQGAWRVRSDRIRPLHRRARQLSSRFRTRFRWVPREQNQEADALSVKAYVEYQEANRYARIADVLPRMRRLGPGHYVVQARGKTYQVNLWTGTCTCPDFKKMHSRRFPIRCKHILAAQHAERVGKYP